MHLKKVWSAIAYRELNWLLSTILKNNLMSLNGHLNFFIFFIIGLQLQEIKKWFFMGGHFHEIAKRS